MWIISQALPTLKASMETLYSMVHRSHHISPVYVMPSLDNTQKITEALAKVTQLQRLPQTVQDVFNSREEKDKTRFLLGNSL